MTWFGRHLPAIATVLVGASIVAALSALGLFQAWVSPDTASFIAAWASQAPLAEMRLPPYGGLASWVMASPAALALLPAVQVGLFLAASVWLVESLRRLEVSHSACLATGLALGGSNLVMLWGNALLPEMLGHAALLAGMAVVVEIAAGLPSLRRGVVAGVAVSLAWALRSSLLPFVVLLPLLLPALPHRVRHCARVTALLVVACLGPMLGWSAYRARQVGDFNVVSFGGFLMSGMSALMLTPSLAERLPERDREVARAIIAGRTALEASGDAMAVPANSTGQRSFVCVFRGIVSTDFTAS